MIKSKKTVKKLPPKFPCLMTTSEGTIMLYKDENHGIIVHTESGFWEVGDLAVLAGGEEVFHGTITLSNN